MNNIHQKKAGIALIIFVILLVFTMVLHPAGGSIERLIKITKLIVITHAIAIASLPFGWIGFWGLTRRLDNFTAMLGFAFISLGLVAVMMAAALNGIVTPIFLQDYKDAAPESINAIRPVLKFAFAANHAFDYIYTGAFCAGILSWSVAILRTKKLAVWTGWLGIVLVILATIIFTTGVAVNDLRGFMIFVMGIVVWVLSVGANLYKQENPSMQ